MIVNGVHESTEKPSSVLMITGLPTKCSKHESAHDAVIDVAKVIAHAFTTSQKGQTPHKW